MPPKDRFLDPRRAGPEGVVALSNDLDAETLAAAYARGIFPWPSPGLSAIPWCCPDPRAVLEFDRLTVPRTVRQEQRKGRFRFTLDAAFARVIAACARVPRPGQRSTWITPEMARAYERLHALGLAHSVEAWEGESLAGGLYGVAVEGVFAGESMFHLAPNASKLALLFLVEHLRARGAEWMDIQMLTPHLEALGAREIPRDDYLGRLAEAQARKLRLF
jgi:leucyl/phenylalanyl-tRNA--protein transferase